MVQFFNDLQLLPWYALWLLGLIILLIGSLLLHEIGHWMYFRFSLKKNVDIRCSFFKNKSILTCEVGKITDYRYLTDQQYVSIISYGLLFGSIPIIISGLMYLPNLLLLVPYGICIKDDIHELIKFTRT